MSTPLTFEQRQLIRQLRSEHARHTLGPQARGPLAEVRRCQHILVWGRRVGEPCGSRARGDTERCGLHTRKTDSASAPPA